MPPKKSDLTTSDAEASASLDANTTKFRNLYIPTIIIPDEKDPYDNEPNQPFSTKYQQIDLDDDNAARFADTTRVGWKGRVDYALKAYETQRRKAEATEREPARDPNALLNTSITTVILLASGIYDIPIQYYMYTELYLLSIKDEFGDSPPNIKNLIRHIRFIRQSNDISWPEPIGEDPPPGLVVSRIRNRSRIPLSMYSKSQRSGHTNTFGGNSPKSPVERESNSAERPVNANMNSPQSTGEDEVETPRAKSRRRKR